MEDKELITDEQIENVWGNANFGEFLTNNKRELINNTVLKCASGYVTGSTAKRIVQELALVTTNWRLTALGKRYLFAVFSQGKSY
jgi:hypothetical protein